jgi:hypothetical protein
MNQQHNLGLSSIVAIVEASPSFQVEQCNVTRPSEIVAEKQKTTDYAEK